MSLIYVILLDIKSTFLYGDLCKEIYLEQLEEYTEVGQENLVCRLNTFLYGLKQALRIWNTLRCFNPKI